MTSAEQRIVEFLLTTNPTELDELPDWLLSLIEGDGHDGMSHELITAASLMFVRRQFPGIGYGAARKILASYAADPVTCDELAKRIIAFRLSCCFERLKRAGRYEQIRIDDPFDPDGTVSVTLTETDWEYLKSNPTESDVRRSRRTPVRWSTN